MWRVQEMMKDEDGSWVVLLVCRRCWKTDYTRLTDDELPDIPEHDCHPAWER